MEEQKRKEKDHGKWTKMKNIFRVKAKKIKVASYQNNDNKDNKREDGRNSDSDDERLHREKTIAPFMKEYHYKKQMDHVLDEQHVREGKPDFKDRIKDSDDDDEVRYTSTHIYQISYINVPFMSYAFHSTITCNECDLPTKAIYRI